MKSYSNNSPYDILINREKRIRLRPHTPNQRRDNQAINRIHLEPLNCTNINNSTEFMFSDLIDEVERVKDDLVHGLINRRPDLPVDFFEPDSHSMS